MQNQKEPELSGVASRPDRWQYRHFFVPLRGWRRCPVSGWFRERGGVVTFRLFYTAAHDSIADVTPDEMARIEREACEAWARGEMEASPVERPVIRVGT